MSLTVAPPLGVVLLVLCMSWAPVHGASQAASTTPVVAVPGPRTLGDPFYPTLGNGGYDVRAYDLDLTWNPPDAVHPQGWVDGIVDIDLSPTEDLSDLSMDLTRRNSHVTGVTIDGHSVEHRPDVAGQKLIVIPDDVLMAGTQVSVRVAWTATPLGVNRLGEELPLLAPGMEQTAAARLLARGFLSDGEGGFFMASQPNGAHTLFPANDHPADKAQVTVRLTAPAGMLGVATGVRSRQWANMDGTTTTEWRSGHPVATHVLALGVGRWTVLEDNSEPGPHLRSSVPTDLAALAPARADIIAGAVAWLERNIGRRYPFGSLGVQLVAPGATDAVLEGQTLILAGAGVLDPRVSECDWRGLVVHETVHQWFGDSVSLMRWDQKWLSEGHATFYEHLWEAAAGCDPAGFEARMHAIYMGAQAARDVGGPPDRPREPRFAYDQTIYDQGALALFALRQRVGEATFRVIETTWLDRYADSSASTDQFIALATEAAGVDLSGFLAAWLRGDTVPPMPGHPDWTSSTRSPAGSSPPAAQPSAVPSAS